MAWEQHRDTRFCNWPRASRRLGRNCGALEEQTRKAQHLREEPWANEERAASGT
jgi:hypothetical protein